MRQLVALSRCLDKIITKMLSGFIDSDATDLHNVATNQGYTSDAPVDVKTSFPQNLQSRLNELFGSKFVVKKVFISNKRFAKNNNVYGKTIRVGTGSKTIHASYDIFISYRLFKNKLRWTLCKQADDRDSKTMEAKGLKIDHGSIDENNIDAMIRTIVHEAYHCWQSQTDYDFDDTDSRSSNEDKQREHENNKRQEISARDMANKFRILESDRDWIRKLLQQCAEQELVFLKQRKTHE